MLFGEHSIGIINAKKADTVNAAGPEMKKKKKKKRCHIKVDTRSA